MMYLLIYIQFTSCILKGQGKRYDKKSWLLFFDQKRRENLTIMYWVVLLQMRKDYTNIWLLVKETQSKKLNSGLMDLFTLSF